jgi:adenosylmethionine-8-amino-7-oxononanoate aminotransferase
LSKSTIWPPFTPLSTAIEPLKVVRGRGSELVLEDGRTLIDGISSWWVNLHGHAHPAIAEAIAEQARTLEHVIFAGYTHEPAQELAERITALLPERLNRVFFSDNGSTAVEVALKMAWQFWRNQNNPKRNRILAFENAYHGDTFGAMAAGARSIFFEAFEPLMFDVTRLPNPETWIGDSDVEIKEAQALAALRKVLQDAPEAYAALILEPLVQGAGGMKMARASFVREACELARDFGVLVIYDEVMTGFGRTGELFAFRKVGFEPDFLCLSKGLTGGFLPMSLTITGERVQEAFRSADLTHTFWHGHSYTANPLGCAAALASLTLTERALPILPSIEERHLAELALGGFKAETFRVCGTILAMDVPVGTATGYTNPVGSTLRAAFLEDGLLLRPLGNTVYVMAPYCTTSEQYDSIYATLRRRLAAI